MSLQPAGVGGLSPVTRRQKRSLLPALRSAPARQCRASAPGPVGVHRIQPRQPSLRQPGRCLCNFRMRFGGRALHESQYAVATLCQSVVVVVTPSAGAAQLRLQQCGFNRLRWRLRPLGHPATSHSGRRSGIVYLAHTIDGVALRLFTLTAIRTAYVSIVSAAPLLLSGNTHCLMRQDRRTHLRTGERTKNHQQTIAA